MKKIYLLFILLFSIGSFLKAQTDSDLYGISFSYDSAFTVRTTAFAKIDPDNGNLSISTTWKGPAIYAFGCEALDPKHKMFYQVTTDPWNLFILKIDMNTGIIVDTVFSQDSLGTGDTVFTWLPSEISSMMYNCTDDHIYFTYETKNKDIDNSSVKGTRIAKIDALTGKVNLVTILPGYFFESDQKYCDLTHQKIILHRFVDDNLYTYDLQTNKLSFVTLSKKYGGNQGYYIAWNKNDGQLYGIEYDYSFLSGPASAAKCEIIKINPATGAISEVSSSFDCNPWGSLYFESSNNKLYFVGQTINGGPSALFTVDIGTKVMSLYPNTNIPNTNLFTGIYGVSSLPANATFMYKNSCQQEATEFHSTTRSGSIDWDFGDPASGDQNVSYEFGPRHIYTNSGTYEVKMILSNCWQTDTVIKQIVITPFPKIDLGTDKTWCINKQEDQFVLKVDAPGTSYFWQDLSTNDTYTVKQPGIYWVDVSSGSCETRDSMIVRESDCPCDIIVAPTVTHSSVSFNFDCYLSTYNTLYLELYDERAQLVMTRRIEESTITLNLEPLAAGIYFYRIRDKNSILKSGKVIFMR
jgi:hypothetical protein